MSQIRTLSYLLHPPSLETGDLSTTLKWYIAGFSERSEIQVALHVPETIGPLPAEYKLVLFRIMQECLTNVHRHSRSPWAAVRLIRKAHSIRLEIADRGKGMDLLPRVIQTFHPASESSKCASASSCCMALFTSTPPPAKASAST